MTSPRSRKPSLRWLAPLAAMLLAAGCAGSKPTNVAQFEEFDRAETHSRPYGASQGRTCEAARRALLSQGYLIDSAGADLVQGKKSFQPQPETHVELQLRVVCVKTGGEGTMAFVSALQDRYALKKSANSASLGVGALGSVSLPFTSGDDSLVKVASETVASEPFYERFYALLGRYLAETPEPPAPPAPAPAPAPAAPPAVFVWPPPGTGMPVRPAPADAAPPASAPANAPSAVPEAPMPAASGASGPGG